MSLEEINIKFDGMITPALDAFDKDRGSRYFELTDKEIIEHACDEAVKELSTPLKEHMNTLKALLIELSVLKLLFLDLKVLRQINGLMGGAGNYKVINIFIVKERRDPVFRFDESLGGRSSLIIKAGELIGKQLPHYHISIGTEERKYFKLINVTSDDSSNLTNKDPLSTYLCQLHSSGGIKHIERIYVSEAKLRKGAGGRIEPLNILCGVGLEAGVVDDGAAAADDGAAPSFHKDRLRRSIEEQEKREKVRSEQESAIKRGKSGIGGKKPRESPHDSESVLNHKLAQQKKKLAEYELLKIQKQQEKEIVKKNNEKLRKEYELMIKGREKRAAAAEKRSADAAEKRRNKYPPLAPQRTKGKGKQQQQRSWRPFPPSEATLFARQFPNWQTSDDGGAGGVVGKKVESEISLKERGGRGGGLKYLRTKRRRKKGKKTKRKKSKRNKTKRKKTKRKKN